MRKRRDNGGNDGDIEEKLKEYLARPPAPIEPDLAAAMLRHILECEACGSLTASHDAHAVMLLQADAPDDESAEELDVVRASQQEILVVADAMLGRLPKETRRALERSLSEDRRRDVFALGGASPAQLRAALAVGEAVLMLQSFLSSRNTRRSNAWLDHERLEVRGKQIPASYFAERIADFAEMKIEEASQVWRKIVDLAFEGRVGLPGISAEPMQSRVNLALEEDPRDVDVVDFKVMPGGNEVEPLGPPPSSVEPLGPPRPSSERRSIKRETTN